MKKRLIKAICSMAIVATTVSMVGCGSKDVQTTKTSSEATVSEKSSEPQEIELVKSKGKTYEIAVPKEWEAINDKDDKVAIHQEFKAKNYNLLVSSENKSSLPKNSNIQNYATKTIEDFKKAFKDTTYSPIKPIKIGEKDCVQFNISATIQGTNYTYFITALDDGTNIVRISLWTPSDKFDEARDLFNQITNSFK